MTVGLYIFEEVEQGDYILEIKREGFMVRWAMISIGDDVDPVFLEHREIIPGDNIVDFLINVMDLNNLMNHYDANYIFDPENYWQEVGFDLNADGKVNVVDLNLLNMYIGFKYYHYLDTKQWLDELGIDY
jgi:hypothetical protein